MEEGIKEGGWTQLPSTPDVQRKHNFHSEGWLAVSSAYQGERDCSACWEASLVMEQVPCVYSAALLWAGEPGPGVRLGRGGLQSLFPKPERFSCSVCCCVVEARMSAALTCGCSLLRRELKLPARSISWLVQILFSSHLALTSSHCSSLFLSSHPLFWVRSSPKPHLSGAGAGFSSREAGCTW